MPRRITLSCIIVAFSILVAFGILQRVRWGSQRNGQQPALAEPVGHRDAPTANTTSPSVTHADLRERFDFAKTGFEDGGFSAANQFMPTIKDPGSLDELRNAVRQRGTRGIAKLNLEYKSLASGATQDRATIQRSLGLLCMYEGRFGEAASWFEKALDTSKALGSPAKDRATLTALVGITALRRGEIENCLECLGPSSCIFPIVPEAVHQKQEGSREAIRWFTRYLEEWPRDIRIVWLLNLAYMTLGEYPEKVPPQFVLPLDRFKSAVDFGRFVNVAPLAGLGSRGPNLAGGSVFDDFTGDNLPDLVSTSLDADRGASFFINRGNGSFEDHSSAAGLDDQVYALNLRHADFDNDGRLDLLLLRGGWESPSRLSLLRNTGSGKFEDVTIRAGLGAPIATEAAAWGDFDNDGWVDVFVCGEYLPPGGNPAKSRHEPRNRCRLYRNRGDGTFIDVAAAAGVTNERCAKGAAWGDYDGDGMLDLFVSNMGQECRLYRNEGGGVFRDVAQELDVTGSDASFACWFWDYDNDGRSDLYVNDYRAKSAEVLASAMGIKLPGASRPRLYRNLGIEGFRDVTHAVGLDRAMAPMGANFGDLDNDGYLDMYLGTGDMSYSGLDLNLMFRNAGGKRFDDVSLSSGTAHLQKGHGVSFADWNNDGGLDLFVELGGATPGDRSYNVLFQNPIRGRHWLKVKLIGTRTNRAALGAGIRVDVRDSDGKLRSIYRTVGNNSSFGGNSFVETIGLLDATVAEEIEVSWPTSRTKQVFRKVPADQAIAITEGSDRFDVLALSPFSIKSD